ncbi:MAG: ATP-dependent helicase, partial [Anaerolineaceae bacterium]|nr:ATP-dependent helicase [Anaerolineaceae bacterium]
MFNPRPGQDEVVAFRHGRMGVAAVPGSGKTQTLSYLASCLIRDNCINEDQEVLIVTLVNSAVNNFASRIEGFLKQYGYIPGSGYRVRTLHGLAHDIVRERPDLAGLDSQFQIVDEREAASILDAAASAWMRSNPDFLEMYTSQDQDLTGNYRLQRDWQKLIVQSAGSFIRLAKDLQAAPEDLMDIIDDLDVDHPMLRMGVDIYTTYQQGLRYRSAVDFDDLIRLALRCLRNDPAYLDYLHFRWPYILEDEAQDSSRLQEQILHLIAGEDGNWVRVGDPNQAIFETFTTANPQFLMDFIHQPDVQSSKLPISGRSTRSIIDLANHLVHWTREEHPNLSLRDALKPNDILPTPPGDPQPNPPDQPDAIHLSINKKISPEKEVAMVVNSLKKWLPDNQDSTVAVLVPRNDRGAKVVEALKENGIEAVELLRSSVSARHAAAILSSILEHLSTPSSSTKLAQMYRLVARIETNEQQDKDFIKKTSNLIRTCAKPEEYLWPVPGHDWLAELRAQDTSDEHMEELTWLRALTARWQKASLLPIDQLVLTIAQDIFTHPVDLAIAHKLAAFLESVATNRPGSHLPEYIIELEAIVRNNRKFLGFSEEYTGFDPEQHRGKVVVATVHKAKGLEWDRVYLL